MESEGIKGLLKKVHDFGNISISEALKWSKKFYISNEIHLNELSSAQIAVLVYLYEIVHLSPEWSFLPFLGKVIVNLTNADVREIRQWLRTNYRFRTEDIYLIMSVWMDNSISIGVLGVYYLNKTYEILQLAASKGDLSMIKWLLAEGVEIDRRDSAERTALHAAAKNGHATLVEYLRTKGASVFVMDNNGNTPFELAFDHNHFDVADQLHPLSFINSELFLSSVEGGNKSKVSYILRYATASEIKQAMRTAAHKGIVEIVDILLQHHVTRVLLDDKDDNGNTPLSLAVQGNYPKVVEKLLAAGAQLESDVVGIATCKNFKAVEAEILKFSKKYIGKNTLFSEDEFIEEEDSIS